MAYKLEKRNQLIGYLITNIFLVIGSLISIVVTFMNVATPNIVKILLFVVSLISISLIIAWTVISLVKKNNKPVGFLIYCITMIIIQVLTFASPYFRTSNDVAMGSFMGVVYLLIISTIYFPCVLFVALLSKKETKGLKTESKVFLIFLAIYNALVVVNGVMTVGGFFAFSSTLLVQSVAYLFYFVATILFIVFLSKSYKFTVIPETKTYIQYQTVPVQQVPVQYQQVPVQQVPVQQPVAPQQPTQAINNQPGV